MRLDQALGILAEPRRPLAEPPVHMARLVLTEPLVTADGITAAVTRLAGELVQGLADAHRGALEVVLSLYRVDGTVAGVRIGTSTPSRDAAHLLRLMGERLDRVDAGFGIDVMTLAAIRTGPLPPSQTAAGALGQSLPEGRLARLVDSLANRLGADRVLRTGLGASHIPERAAVNAPAMTRGAPSRAEDMAPPATGETAPVRPPSSPRPPMLLPRPEPIGVLAEVPEGAPQRFTWRRLTRRIKAARGPERIEPEWWRHLDADPAAGKGLRRVRDYWQIEDDGGGRYWVFRDGAWSEGGAERPRWYLHGLYG